MKYLAVSMIVVSCFAATPKKSASAGEAPQASQTTPQAPQMAASPTPTPRIDENTRKARAVLDKMLKALGGDAYLTIKDMEQAGRTNGFYHGQPADTGAPFWRSYRYPDKDRIELTKERDWVILNIGDKGYEITFRGVRDQDPKDVANYVRRREYNLDRVLRDWLRDPAVALFDNGSAYVDGKQTEEIAIINGNNQSVTLFIDNLTSLPVKKTFFWRDPVDKQKDEEVEIYDGYRLIQGIQTPFNVTRIRNGEMQNQRFLFTVTYNQGLADSLFQPLPLDADASKHDKNKDKRRQ